MRRQQRTAHEDRPWWFFAHAWPMQVTGWLTAFCQGEYLFSPMKQYHFVDEVVQIWEYADRLIMACLYALLKPTFKSVILPTCCHLSGPSEIKTVTQRLRMVLASGEYHYEMRIDIGSYYASIQHSILLKQLFQHYQDPRLHHYFKAIVGCAIDKGGHIELPTKGLPRRSSLSPFFGVLYLSSVDQAFNRKAIFYLALQGRFYYPFEK
jgi:RNA-directed DNA polymerase